MFCFKKIYTFSLREEDFKQSFWAQPPFLSHIRFGSVVGVFCFAVGLENERFESGFHFRFMVLWVFSRWFRVGKFGEIHGGMVVGFVSFSYFCCRCSLLYSVVF